jgi:hypothetical protein
MVYYKIIKIEVIESVLTHSAIGYISPVNKDTFETIHGCPLIEWVEENPTLPLEDYFDTNEPCHLLDTASSEIPDGLPLTSPNTATITDHTHNTGDDGLLLVNVFYINTKNCTGVTWNGTALTLLTARNYTNAGAALSFDIWYLKVPATGNHDLVYTFDVGGGNCTSLITSFTGADQTTPLKHLHTGAQNTPNSQTITISENSMIQGIGCSRYSFDTNDAINIDGTGFGFGFCDIDTAVSSAQICAETRNTNLSAGTKTVITDTIADSFQASNTRVEILEAAAPPPSTRRRMWIC